ncbi:MAG TPA: hypothetical protein VHB99_18110 [Pirellulales bacterium]|nr:hypothetical protein [Pirellulales bacterium]
MSQTPFRFVHASDFHLERPPHGVNEAPEHLRNALVEAPYRAAERVIDLALAEQVDFLVLAGGLLHAETTGPRGPLFLAEQFQRLEARGIQVYWAGGPTDPPENWPAFAPLPDNVHVFPERKAEEIVHYREGEALSRLVGLSRRQSKKLRPGDFAVEEQGPLAIAVTFGEIDRAAIANRGIRYWALGGRRQRETLSESPALAHFPGTMQGRQPSEAGPCGCTLVEVDADGKLRTRLAPTDVLRYRCEEIQLDEPASKQHLERALLERLRTIAATTPGVDQLISWTVCGAASLTAPLRRGGWSGELLAKLRNETGYASPAVWSVSLVADSSEAPSSWYQQDTLLGDYLRAIRDQQSAADDDAAELDLAGLLDARQLAGAFPAAARLDDATRQRVLRKAALLGADLLSGEETPS